jgi:hypothetical protein
MAREGRASIQRVLPAVRHETKRRAGVGLLHQARGPTETLAELGARCHCIGVGKTM